MSNIIRKETREKVQFDEIGLYIRLIHLDYKVQSPSHLATLITEHFNKECSVEDIKKYEQIYLDAIEKEQLYINDFLPKE
jgi:hypothetical protein